MPLARKLQQWIDDLAVLDDPQERLAHIVDRAKKTPPLPDDERTEANRVRGCISVVWLAGELRDGRCIFGGDAESPIVRGLLVFYCEFFSGHTPAEILRSDADPLEGLDLMRNLSPTRRNGLASALARIREFARTATAAAATTPDA